MAKKTYESAMSELQAILQEMEENEIPIDELSKKVKKASELIRWCRSKLKETENDVDEALKELEFDD